MTNIATTTDGHPAVGAPLAAAAPLLHKLTSREREVLALIAKGLSNSAIDRQLAIAPKTTERHITRVYAKLDLADHVDAHRRVQAVLVWRAAHGPDRPHRRRG